MCITGAKVSSVDGSNAVVFQVIFVKSQRHAREQQQAAEFYPPAATSPPTSVPSATSCLGATCLARVVISLIQVTAMDWSWASSHPAASQPVSK
jgi:hypothetical protein